MSTEAVIPAAAGTDVDDVLTRTAAERKVDYDEFGLRQEFWFDRTMSALHIRPPEHAPHARHHVRHVVALAGTLLAAGKAYERGGTVYFRGAQVPGAAGLDPATALALAAEYGDEPHDPGHEDPFDVPLWKPSMPNARPWRSPPSVGWSTCS